MRDETDANIVEIPQRLAWGRGGYRPGAGRKPGSTGIRAATATEFHRDGGVLPLHVLVHAMRKHWDAHLRAESENLRVQSENELHLAVAFAEKACPYLHPRLTAVEMREIPLAPASEDALTVALLDETARHILSAI